MPGRFDRRLYDIMINKLLTQQGITNRTQLNTYISNGATLVDRIDRYHQVAGWRFDGETDDNALKATIDAVNPPT